MDELDIDELCSAIQEEMNWQLEEWRNERKGEIQWSKDALIKKEQGKERL